MLQEQSNDGENRCSGTHSDLELANKHQGSGLEHYCQHSTNNPLHFYYIISSSQRFRTCLLCSLVVLLENPKDPEVSQGSLMDPQRTFDF